MTHESESMKWIAAIVHRASMRAGTFTGGVVLLTIKVFRRFPFPAGACLAASGLLTAATLFADEHLWQNSIPFIFPLILSAPLFTAFRLFRDERGQRYNKGLIGNIFILILMAGYSFYLMNDYSDHQTIESIRFAALMSAAVLTIPCAPFIGVKKDLAASYAIDIGMIVSVSLVFAAVIYGGIAAALLIFRTLFDISFPSSVLKIAFISVVGVIAPIQFLAALPKKRNEAEKVFYPKPLLILIRRILLPLVLCYLAIIYLYFAKAIITVSWPEGTAAILILIFSGVGIFLLFAVSPIESEGDRWVSRYARYLYRSLIPLLPLLYVAIGRRVFDYGITARRYFVILMALWLTGITIYWILSRRKRHFVIPASLVICAFLSVVGPWDAFNVSKMSQSLRLNILLKRNGFIENGIIVKGGKDRKIEDKGAIVETIRYLYDVYGSESLKIFDKPVRDSGVTQILTEGLGMPLQYWYAGDEIVSLFSDRQELSTVNITGYQYFTDSRSISRAGGIYFGDGARIELLNSDRMVISNRFLSETIDLLQSAGSLPEVKKSIQAGKKQVPIRAMIVEKNTKAGKIMIVFDSLSIRFERNEPAALSAASFYIFYRGIDRTESASRGR
jgi:hypothetical protein